MILAGNIKPGTKILYNNEPYQVTDTVFVKPGKGGAFVRTKMKSYITELIREVTFRTEEKLDQHDLIYKEAKFLYEDGNNFCFMDEESFEEIFISKNLLKNFLLHIKDDEKYTILFWNEKFLSLTPPIHMYMKVLETPPGIKGDTAQGGATKPATLESGLIIQVPLFININDIIKIDTRNNEYIERIK